MPLAADTLRARREAIVREHMDSRAFPDQEDEILDLHHAEDAVLLEMVTRGTHLGPLRGLPPTGGSLELRFACIFAFEGERLVCERVYFDSNTVLRHLGVARDPLSLAGRLGTAVGHPLTIGRGIIRQVIKR
jgi:predicted ester cyclase